MSQSLPPRKPQQAPEGQPASQGEEDRNHYSLDDIMDTLRDTEREKDEQGEIVTRSDGTQARKVRRRKRRSDQPDVAKKKKTKADAEAKKRKSLILKISLVVGLSLIALLSALFTLMRYNSEAYASEVEQVSGEWSGAEVEVNGLRLLPGSVEMNRAQFAWGEGYFTKALNLQRVSGHIGVTSFLGQKMGGRELGGYKGTLELRSPEGGARWIEPLAEEDFPFSFQRYYCDALNVVFGTSGTFQLNNTHASLRYLTGTGWKLHLNEGVFALKGWHPFPVKIGLIGFKEGELELSSLKLACPEVLDSLYEPVITVSGRIPLQPGKQATLEFDTKNFPLEGLVGEDLGSLFSGSVRSIKDSKLVFTIGEDKVDEIFMPFDGEFFEWKKFPFVRTLMELFPDKGFDECRFGENIEGVFRYLPKGKGLQDLKMTQSQLMRISDGNIFVSHDGAIKGHLRMYLSRGLVNGDPNLKILEGFSKVKAGYSIIDFELGGTIDLPEDNFRVVTGVDTSNGIFDAGRQQPKKFEDLFEELTSPESPTTPEISAEPQGFDDLIKDNTQDNTGR